MLNKLIPWSFRGVSPFLNTYGDSLLFGKIKNTPPIEVNPDAPIGIHTSIPHRYLHAYLCALKSFLRFYNDVAVMAHDDGTLTDEDVKLIKNHLPGVKVIRRQFADDTFNQRINDPFLSKIRTSYTSYLKLFDSTLFSEDKRIMVLDTDTLFLKKPDRIIDWCQEGGTPWFHRSPVGSWNTKHKKDNKIKAPPISEEQHIQALVAKSLNEINSTLDKQYKVDQGFCSGCIGYDASTINFDELKQLLELLYSKFGERIFKWGAEQTVHGMILGGLEAEGLPVEEYFVMTRNNFTNAHRGTFVHFVGENRFYKFIYPKLAKNLIKDLKRH